MSVDAETKRDQPKVAVRNLAGGVGKLGRFLGAQLSLPGIGPKRGTGTRDRPGSSPGIESLPDLDKPPSEGVVRLECVDYGVERAETKSVSDLKRFLEQSRPEFCTVRWLNVDGLHPYIVNQLREHFGFHTLAAEDVLRTAQRPKIENYDSNFFIVVRMLRLQDDQLLNEQVSIFVFKDTLLTFQEKVGDVWDPIRSRIQKTGSRLRKFDTSYLLYALLDAVVDHCFPILERYGEILETLEKDVIENPTPAVQHRIHHVRRELSALRRVIWPLREVLGELQREESDTISAGVKDYFRDVYDHSVQVIDIVETYREMAGGLNDLYMSAVSNRMNEIMKVLTIMASFFIPITFVAGVYGMNFEVLPELHWKYSYLGFWMICGLISCSLAVFFIRKGWIGGK